MASSTAASVPPARAEWGRGAPLAHPGRRYLAYGAGRCPEDGGSRPPGGSPHTARAPDRVGRGRPRGHGGRRACGVRLAVRPDQRDHQRLVVRADRRGGGGRLAGAGRRPGRLRPAGAGRRRRGVPEGHTRDADSGGRRGHPELPAQDRSGPGVRGDRAAAGLGAAAGRATGAASLAGGAAAERPASPSGARGWRPALRRRLRRAAGRGTGRRVHGGGDMPARRGRRAGPEDGRGCGGRDGVRGGHPRAVA